MIISSLQHSERIESLHPLFKMAFDYIKSHDLLNTPCGRIELQGDDLFINNVNPECIAAEKQVLEMACLQSHTMRMPTAPYMQNQLRYMPNFIQDNL